MGVYILGGAEQLRKGTYSFIEQTLLDYNEIDKHIKKRVEELTYPVSVSDENVGGSRSGNVSNPTQRLAVTIMDDMLISNLKHTKYIVDEVLDGLEPEARKVIQLYYIDSPRKFTWNGVAGETNFSEKQCRNIRNAVFEKIANKLGMPV